VKLATQADRRRDPRFPQSLEIIVRAFPTLGPNQELGTEAFQGRIQNISEGGVCLCTSHSIDKSTLFRCEFTIDDVPLKLATLMQVRWTKKQNLQPESYLSGLEFLL
jgi:PilZ domain